MVTKEEFINRAKNVHGNKYDYSKVAYKKITDKVCIICPEHGEFWQEARAHYRGQGCPKCGAIKKAKSKTLTKEEFIKKAELIFGKEYDFSNINYINTHTKIKLWCKKHGEFEITPHALLSEKRGCPKCGRESSAKYMSLSKEKFIEISKLVHGNKYDYSKVIYKNNRTPVIVTCPVHGDFFVRPEVHMSGHECPICASEKRAKKHIKTTDWFIEKSKRIHGNKYDYSKVEYKNIFSPVTIICPKHGEFRQIASYHVSGNGCPKCGFTTSYAENKIYDFVKSLFPDAEQSNRNIIPPYEIDIYIPSKKIGIEYNGILWHSEKYKEDKNYHLKKLNMCKEKGIKLIQIFEDEFVKNDELVLEKIKHILGKSDGEKIMARKCTIKEILKEDAEEFLNKYHIQGFSISSKYIGLYNGEDLVSVMSFKKEKDIAHWELTRFATKMHYTIQGGGGKLFSYFVKTYDPSEIKSFADRRWTINENNNLYIKLGFDNDGYVAPDYKYFKKEDGIVRHHKFGFRKQILHKKYGLPLTMTESEMTAKLGYSKIYDCGLIRYLWTKKAAD